MEWIIYTLFAAFLFAVGNFVDKYISQDKTSGCWDFLFSYGLINWLFVFGFFLLFGIPNLDVYFLWAFGGGLLVGVTGWFYVRALQIGEVSRLVILFQIIPLTSALLAWIFLGQTLGWQGLAAFCLVLIGSTIVLVDKKEEIHVLAPGAGAIVMFSILWGIVFVITDYAVQHMPFWDYVYIQTMGVAFLNILLLAFSRPRKEIVSSFAQKPIKYVYFCINNGFDLLGKMSIVHALVITSSAGLVTVLLQTQSLFSLCLGVILTLLLPHFSENTGWQTIVQKLVGALVIFIGILVLVL